MDKELNQVKYDIHKLETMIEVLAKDIQDIKEALLGNDFGNEGLVKKVQSNEKNIAELVKFKQKIVAYATGLSVGSGALVNYLMELIK
jgi:t-SNARE complex subunit (syntaxin)